MCWLDMCIYDLYGWLCSYHIWLIGWLCDYTTWLIDWLCDYVTWLTGSLVILPVDWLLVWSY